MINHENNFATNLTSNVTAGDTTSPLNSIPTSTAPFYLAFDATNINSKYEVVYVSSKTATNVNHAALSNNHTTAEEVRLILPAEEADAISSGWIKVNETWAYASADDPTYVITIPTGGTARYSVGEKVKFTNNSTTFYGIVTAVASTTLTVYGGTDYDVANSAITAIYVSRSRAPHGFPLDVTKWSVTNTDTTGYTQATPTADVWYNLGSVTISIPIGIWNANYQVCLMVDDTSSTITDVYSTLSTANNSESDNAWTAVFITGGASGTLYCCGTAYRSGIITAAAKTAYYLNTKTHTADVSNIYNLNSSVQSKLIIRATCAYL